MAQAKYRTREYRAAYAAVRAAQADGDWLTCVEPLCLEEQDGNGRAISPITPACISHDPSGTVLIGAWPHASHARCNYSEAATRGNQMRIERETRRLVL